MLLIYLAKWHALLAVTQHQKGTKFHKKTSMLVHIVELSTAVVKFDIKVSLTEKSMFTMCNAALNACWDTATVRRHWTEQWRHEQAGRHPLPNRSDIINFSKRDFINNDSNFCSHILLAIDLKCQVFPFEKLLLKCPSSSVNGILMTSSPRNDVAVLGWIL